MEALLHLSPVPMPPPATPRQQPDANAAAVMQHASSALQPVTMAGREQCPRCASRDTKFCYYNNYNTAQPRHFCRACRRYWTLGGSLRNVPVGGSTRKRPRPARPTRALAAAVANAAATTTTTTASSSCGPIASTPVAAPAPASGPALSAGLLSSLLLGSASSPLLPLGAAPLLEGRLNFDLGLGQPAGAGDYLSQLMGFGAGPRLWPAATVLEGDRAQPTSWKANGGVFPPPTAALWQEELAASAPTLLHQPHHGAPPLLLL